MKFNTLVALPVLAQLVVPHAVWAFIIPEGDQQAVFVQHNDGKHGGLRPHGKCNKHGKHESLDELFAAAASLSENAPDEKDDDLEIAYANSWVSFVEPRRHCHGKKNKSFGGENSPSSSWWKVVKETISRSSVGEEVKTEITRYTSEEPHHPPPPHPPHDKPDHPPHGPPPPPHKRPHGKRPHHHPHNFTSHTIYENLGRSNFTKKIFALISNDTGLVKILNSTATNITFFAPTDKAFENIPEHAHKPSKEFIKNLLYYHASGDFYPARKVLQSHTIPSLLKDPALGGPDALQRLRVGLGFKGLTINFYSKVILPNVFASNGVIHAIDHILVPPPPALKVLEILPGTFSTLVNGLYKTGVIESLASNDTLGLTLFAPTNDAFKALGPRILGFLFSKYGEKYLAGLLKYHIVPNQTLYSDAWYHPESDDSVFGDIPKGRFHADLKTLLEGKSLAIDIGRWSRFITFKINSFTSVVVQDGIVKDGVIQIPNHVLIPPKTTPPNAFDEAETSLTLEAFKARLEPYIEA